MVTAVAGALSPRDTDRYSATTGQVQRLFLFLFFLFPTTCPFSLPPSSFPFPPHLSHLISCEQSFGFIQESHCVGEAILELKILLLQPSHAAHCLTAALPCSTPPYCSPPMQHTALLQPSHEARCSPLHQHTSSPLCF